MRTVMSIALLLVSASQVPAAEPVTLTIGYVQPERRMLTLSLTDRPTADRGLAGARLAIDDNNTTGRFTGQSYVVTEARAEGVEAVEAATLSLIDSGARWIVTDLPAEETLAAADAAAGRGVIVFNAGSPDDALRQSECRANLIHTAPSRTMLADALAQYLVVKRWQRWFLVFGSHPEDQAFADALRRAAARFGAEIVEERQYTDTGGARTTDSGHVQVQAQMPVFLQDAAAHDVVVVADENEVFGAYVPYHTWDPRPVAGSAGLVPAAWSPAHEQWAGVQVQNRFRDKFHRPMENADMLAWMAVRMVGEAATRANSGEQAAVDAYMLGDRFQLAAFKGEALSVRDWDLQLRQPILLSDGKQVVSVSPQDGFLHPTSFLDTLGIDRPETECNLEQRAPR